MNERIRQLKESTLPEIDWEARHYAELNNGEKEKWQDEWFEKFAKLLVREFAQLVEDNMDPQNAWITPASVKEHFGVEE